MWKFKAVDQLSTVNIHTKTHNPCTFMFTPSCYTFRSVTLTIIAQRRHASTNGIILYRTLRLYSQSINPLKTKRRLLYLKTQSVPRSKHFRLGDQLIPEASKVKSKAIPLQALTGPESYRRLRLPDFKTVGT